MSIVQKYMHYYTTQRKPETAVVLVCASCSETPMMLVFIYLQLKVTKSRGAGMIRNTAQKLEGRFFQRNGWEMVMWEGGESGGKNSQVCVITEDHFCSSFGIIKKNLLIWKRNEKIVPGVCDAAFPLYLLKIVFLFEFQQHKRKRMEIKHCKYCNRTCITTPGKTHTYANTQTHLL